MGNIIFLPESGNISTRAWDSTPNMGPHELQKLSKVTALSISLSEKEHLK
jgi:hypothetical protein